MNFARELEKKQPLEYMRVTVIPVVLGALGTVPIG